MGNVLFQKTRETSISRRRRKLTPLNVTEKSSMLETKLFIVFIKAVGTGGPYKTVWMEWWG